MKLDLQEFGLPAPLAPIAPDSDCYRPPKWPPPSDWVVSTYADGEPLSLWRDPFWEYTPWAGMTFKLWFDPEPTDRRREPLTPTNSNLLRLATTWMIWGPRGPRAWVTLRNRFLNLRRIFVLCSREQISAADLMRYPAICSQLSEVWPSSSARAPVVNILDQLLLGRERLGFCLLDETAIGRLFGSVRGRNKAVREIEQTAYIPPRIWKYQLLRLRECLDGFLEERTRVEDCFNFCVDAYAHNFGSLTAAMQAKTSSDCYLPFTNQGRPTAGVLSGRRFYGPFALTAQRFGIADLLDTWVRPKNSPIDIASLSAYLSLVQWAGLAYIANYTLQRRNEVDALRADCLSWESDPTFGRIPVISGPTTKTDPDSDARWPTSPSVQVAIDAMTAIAKLRIRCAAADPDVQCSEVDLKNPYLYHRAFEPWIGSPASGKQYDCRARTSSFREMLARFPLLFDNEQIRITADDLRQARMFTPDLDKSGRFQVGEVWPFAYHQLRRTGAVNMFGSGLLSDSSIQVILKHLNVLQSHYYGRNYSNLRFSEELTKLTVAARYEVMGRQIQELVRERYVSPLGLERKQEMVVNLVGAKDFKSLVAAGKAGRISFRETRLGGCTKVSPCEYGGIESVARCAGGDGDKPCRDAIFDCEKRASIERQIRRLVVQLEGASQGGRRWEALQAEIQGLRNYLDATNNA